MQLKKIPIATAKQHPTEKILFIGVSGTMYIPKTKKEVEDEEFSPLLQCLLIQDETTQEEVLSHWQSGGTLTF